jgi:hypothetical protein
MSRGLGPSFALATRQKHKQYRDEFLDHEGVCVCVRLPSSATTLGLA